MNYCKRLKGVLLSLDFRQGYISLVRVACKMWGCPCCGHNNAKAWRAYLLKTFNERFGHEHWCFFTITANPGAHKHSAEMTIRNLQQVWKPLYDRLRRFYNKRLEFIRIFEPHRSGRFHMHILINVGLEYDKVGFVIKDKKDEFRHPHCRFLRRAVCQLGGGNRVHIRRVWDDASRTSNVGIVIGYILKYMGKQMADFEFPKHQRRVQTSRAIGSPKRNAKGHGVWQHKREISLTYMYQADRPIIDITTGERLTERSFEGEHYYPPLADYRGEDYTT